MLRTMSARDRRALLFAIALAVLGVALLSNVTPQVGAALVLVAIGLGLFEEIVSITSWLRRRRPAIAAPPDAGAVSLRLSAFLAEGNRVARLVPIDDGDVEAMDYAYQAADRWRRTVVDYLDKARLGWSAVFLDDTYGTQSFATNLPRRASLLNWWERRLARLRELALRSA